MKAKLSQSEIRLNNLRIEKEQLEMRLNEVDILILMYEDEI